MVERPVKEVSASQSTGGADVRLGFVERLAFTSGNMARVLMSSMMSAFLLIYYTDVFGISPAAAGTLFLVARLADGINDPLMGYLVDRLPVTRWGRFRPALLFGALFAGLNFVALFAAPELSTMGKLVWAYVTYLLYGFVQDLMEIPNRALLPSMSTNIQERNVLSSLSAAMGILGYIIPAVITLPLVARFATPQAGWTAASVVYAVATVILASFMVVGVRERVQPARERNYGLKDLFTIILGNRPLMILLGSFVSINLAVALIGPASVLYFKYNVGRAELFGLTSLLTSVFMAIAIFFFPAIARRLGRRRTYILFGLIGFFANVAFFFVPYGQIPVMLILSVVLAVGMGPPGALNQAMLADTVECTEHRTGKRSEGVIFATISFGNKLVSGLAGAIMGYLLALTGYVPNAVQQTQSALIGINAVKHLGVGLFILISAILFAAYPINEERYAKIVEELAARRKNGAV